MAEEFTGLLAAWRGGDLAARDRLVALVYPELRAIARRELKKSRKTLGAAAAWLTPPLA